VGELFDESEIKADQLAPQKLYLEKGFWDSRVESEIKQMPDNKNVSVVFRIVENDKRKIKKIFFEGNENISSRKLLKKMETAPWRFWRFWSKRSRYRPNVLDEDLNELRTAYRDEGFLDVKIEADGVKISSDGNKNLNLTINVEEGKRSFFGMVNLVGNAVIVTDDLLADTALIQGEPYSPSLSSAERDRLRKQYGEKGSPWIKAVSANKSSVTITAFPTKLTIPKKDRFPSSTLMVKFRFLFPSEEILTPSASILTSRKPSSR
jgi:outer membrane protein insertion porin family